MGRSDGVESLIRVPGMRALIEHGVATPKEFEQMRTLFDGVAFACVGPRQFGLWRRRRASGS
jgi:hypothetical protein